MQWQQTHHKPQNEENAPKFELCRLKKRDYIDGGTNCIYARQTGGKDVVIKVDGKKLRCQPAFNASVSTESVRR